MCIHYLAHPTHHVRLVLVVLGLETNFCCKHTLPRYVDKDARQHASKMAMHKRPSFNKITKFIILLTARINKNFNQLLLVRKVKDGCKESVRRRSGNDKGRIVESHSAELHLLRRDFHTVRKAR